ncbi:MAG: Hsp20/alpha crystallin family protein [Candidatus Babeliaceae bacterium]
MKHIKYVFTVTSFFIATTSAVNFFEDDFFKDFEEQHKKMHEHFATIEAEFEQMLKSNMPIQNNNPQTAITVVEKDHKIILQLPLISAEGIDITYSRTHNHTKIIIPLTDNEKIEMMVLPDTLSVEHHMMKQESKSEKDQPIMHNYQSSHAMFQQNLPQRVVPESVQPEFENGILSLSFEIAAADQRKIPVTIK